MPSVVNPRLKAAPAFLTKLYSMVDLSSERGIGWTPDGLAFVVPHPSSFARDLLPLWYAHSKFSSFVRQLNMYGFHKVHIRNRAVEDESATFQHEYFRRGQPYVLVFIERKKPTSPKSIAGTKMTMVAAASLGISPYPYRSTNRAVSTHPPLMGHDWAIPKPEPDQQSLSPPSIIWSGFPSPTHTTTDLSLSSHSSPVVKPVGIHHIETMSPYRVLEAVRPAHPAPSVCLRPTSIGQSGDCGGTECWPTPGYLVQHSWGGEVQVMTHDVILDISLASSLSGHSAHPTCSTRCTSVSYDGRDSSFSTGFVSPG